MLIIGELVKKLMLVIIYKFLIWNFVSGMKISDVFFIYLWIIFR